MRTVGAREANQHFSALLSAVEYGGETIIITRRGKPVARLVPEVSERVETRNRERSEAMRTLIARFARPMGGTSIPRDELHERGEARPRSDRVGQ